MSAGFEKHERMLNNAIMAGYRTICGMCCAVRVENDSEAKSPHRELTVITTPVRNI